MRSLPLILLLGAAGCATISQKDRDLSLAHLGLAEQSVAAGDPRGALKEVETSVEHDPKNADARNLYGLLLHVSFQQIDRAIVQYREALSLRPGFTEVKVNLGAALTAAGRCGEAIPLLEEAREDLVYREPYLVENNLGWCKIQLGDAPGGIIHLQQAVSLNPGFCLGYRNLGQVMEDQGRWEEALHYHERYGKACPTVADADLRIGLAYLELGRMEEARQAFLACKEKATGDLADQCERKAALLGKG